MKKFILRSIVTEILDWILQLCVAGDFSSLTAKCCRAVCWARVDSFVNHLPLDPISINFCRQTFHSRAWTAIQWLEVEPRRFRRTRYGRAVNAGTSAPENGCHNTSKSLQMASISRWSVGTGSCIYIRWAIWRKMVHITYLSFGCPGDRNLNYRWDYSSMARCILPQRLEVTEKRVCHSAFYIKSGTF